MKMKTICNVVLVVSTSLLQACVGPATRAVHRKSLRLDPPPAKYLGAWKTDTTIYITYRPNPPSLPRHEVVSTQYWASVPISKAHGLDFKGWTIERRVLPGALKNPNVETIPMVDISTNHPPPNSHFLNRDQYLTFVIQTQQIPLPAVLYDPTNFNSFHLISTNMLYGSYRGIWNPPQGTFRNYSTVAKNSWKYPFCMIADIVLCPLNMCLELAFGH
jgi:hypothetical protein